MGKIRNILDYYMYFFKNSYSFVKEYRFTHPLKKEFGSAPQSCIIESPVYIANKQNVFFEEHTKLRHGVEIINSPNEKIIIKKYSAIAANSTFVTNSHRSTVSIPHILLGESHINDKSKDIIVEEDVWIGTGATILAGVTLGRGCVVSAKAVVSHSVPPYALVVGVPASIKAVKFSLDDIIRHEEHLYPESERLSKKTLQDLFEKFYSNVGVFGCADPLSLEEEKKIKHIKELHKMIDYPMY